MQMHRRRNRESWEDSVGRQLKEPRRSTRSSTAAFLNRSPAVSVHVTARL